MTINTMQCYWKILGLCALLPGWPASADDAALKHLGRAASAAEIAAWDIDVKADGSGLPTGKGSVAAGELLYQKKCQACHGPGGMNGTFDTLVGRLPGDTFPFGSDASAVKTIGNYWPYATTLYDYINRAMPFDAPGSLQVDEVYALVAFLLYRNQIIAADMIVTDKNLATIKMPARERFVPQYRLPSAQQAGKSQ